MIENNKKLNYLVYFIQKQILTILHGMQNLIVQCLKRKLESVQSF